jgi:ketol-acid reductoisomerase
MASLASRSASQALRAASRRALPKAAAVSCQVANYSLLARVAAGKTAQTIAVRHLLQRIINH